MVLCGALLSVKLCSVICVSLGFICYWAEVSAAPGTKPKSGAWLMHGVAEVVLH